MSAVRPVVRLRPSSFWTPFRLALFFWLLMVAATAIPLWLLVDRSALAIATVGISIVVGAILFAFVRAEGELRAEIERNATLLEAGGSNTTWERR
jgi:hypothetical protein